MTKGGSTTRLFLRMFLIKIMVLYHGMCKGFSRVEGRLTECSAQKLLIIVQILIFIQLAEFDSFRPIVKKIQFERFSLLLTIQFTSKMGRNLETMREEDWKHVTTSDIGGHVTVAACFSFCTCSWSMNLRTLLPTGINISSSLYLIRFASS